MRAAARSQSEVRRRAGGAASVATGECGTAARPLGRAWPPPPGSPAAVRGARGPGGAAVSLLAAAASVGSSRGAPAAAAR